MWVCQGGIEDFFHLPAPITTMGLTSSYPRPRETPLTIIIIPHREGDVKEFSKKLKKFVVSTVGENTPTKTSFPHRLQHKMSSAPLDNYYYTTLSENVNTFFQKNIVIFFTNRPGASRPYSSSISKVEMLGAFILSPKRFLTSASVSWSQ